jgi:hypothetical protein
MVQNFVVLNKNYVAYCPSNFAHGIKFPMNLFLRVASLHPTKKDYQMCENVSEVFCE